MARLLIDGFESGGFDLCSSFVGVVASTLTGKSGNYCASFPSAGNSIAYVLPESSEIYVAFKLNVTVLNGGYTFAIYNGSTIIGYINASNVIAPTFYSGDTIYKTSLGVSSINIAAGLGWVLYEFYFKPADSGGRAAIKINGVTSLDFTGDTKYGSLSTITGIAFWTGSSTAIYIDDLIIDDANWIGSTSIQGLAVTGAGATTGFTPSTGANYAAVDEVPASDTDYIYTNTPDAVDTYALGNLTGTINSIKAVQVQARCVQEGSPAVPKIQLVTRPAATDRVSASKTVQTFAPKSVFNIWELNPEDSAAWESADVDGMEIGVKAVAT